MKKVLRKAIAFIPPVAVYLIFVALRPNTFLNVSTLLMVFVQSLLSAIIAWGISFDLTAGVLDFSVGAEMALAGVIGAFFSKTMGVMGIVLGCFLSAMLTGLFKAIVMDAIKISSMVVSIAFTYIIASLSTVISSKVPLVVSSSDTVLGKTPWLVTIFLIMGVIMYLLNKFSLFGAKTKALGGSETIAVASGVKPRRIRFATVMLASFYMAVAAIIQVSRGAGAAATQGLQSMSSVFTSMMAFFLAKVLGDYVDVTVGIVSGSLCFSILETGLISINMPANYKNCFVGIGLLVILSLFGITEAKQRKKILKQQSLERHQRANLA